MSIIGICLFSFVPAVLGAEAVNHRPIDHWIQNNPWGCYGGYSGPGKDGNWLAIFLSPLFDYEYEGFILEKVMKDGSLKYTVNLKAYDVDIVIFALSPRVPVLIGKADYTFQIVFILDHIGMDSSGNIGEREPGVELPPDWVIYEYGDVIGAQMLGYRFTCIGSGELTDTGETAKVKVNMRSLIKPQFKEDHPNTWESPSGIEMFPVDNIFVY
ncbi:MAG: hypothetical protein ACFFBE_04925 [Promethearchaeota archaeon]